MKELILKFMGEQGAENRKTLSVDSVPLDESGLRELLVCSNSSYHSFIPISCTLVLVRKTIISC